MILRVLDAFRPRGATWSGQVISSPPGPSEGPSQTHLLPGSGVPRVHRAQSPVPPRLPCFATPRSVHQFAAVAAGAYPPVPPLMRGRPGRRRRRAPATGLSPVGLPWAGAEAALPRGWGMAECATTALAGAVPRPYLRRAGGRSGGLGSVPGVVFLPFPPSRPACPTVRVAGRPIRVSLTLARWYAIPRGLCVRRARSGCPSGSPRVPFACVCARAPAASAPPPPWVVWRAHLARSWHWALVGPFHVVRAPPHVLPRSLPPSGVLGGGQSGPGSSLPGLACTPCGGGVPRGWWGAVPGRGWPAIVVSGVWCQALSLPRPPVLWGGRPGYRDPCVPGAFCAGVGTQHRFHSGRPCGPALLAVRVAEGHPRGGCLPPL